MIGIWVFSIILIVAAIAGSIAIGISKSLFEYQEDSTKALKKTGIIVVIILVVALVVGGMMFWLYGTQQGKRAQKDTESNLGDGLKREIVLYTRDGDIIKKYTVIGDVEYKYDPYRIVFEDENGLRHTISPGDNPITNDETE